MGNDKVMFKVVATDSNGSVIEQSKPLVFSTRAAGALVQEVEQMDSEEATYIKEAVSDALEGQLCMMSDEVVKSVLAQCMGGGKANGS